MHGPLNAEEINCIRRLPAISRAREHYLYTVDGTRWIDCWADGGRMLEGHRPGGLSRRLKNEVDRGLYAAYPSRWENRLEKTLLSSFPGYSGVRLYRNPESALKALASENLPVDPLDLPVGSPSMVEGALWGRLLLPDHPTGDYLLPVMPLPGLSDVQPLLYREGCEPSEPSELISPIILAALTRVILPGKRGKLPIAGESSDIWERRGPYMLYRGDVSDYPALFDALFEKNIIIAPSAERPSVFPSQPGEKESRIILSGGSRR